MAGGEPRLGITWMNMHTQSATNHRQSQEQERDLHAYNPGARRPEFVQSQSLALIASKKFGLEAIGNKMSQDRLHQNMAAMETQEIANYRMHIEKRLVNVYWSMRKL